MSARLCFLEDDPTIRALVSATLRKKGYLVDQFQSAEEVWEADFAEWDLFILDILLEGKRSGRDLCSRIRGFSPSVPVLFLSALSEPSDRVEGLRLGADDYMTKPFETDELLLRVEGMLKRRSWYREIGAGEKVYRWGSRLVDFGAMEGQNGKHRFPLSAKECMLMKLLIEKEGQVVTRSEILDRVWGYHVYPSHRTVDNFVLRLRKQFEPEPSRPRFIHSVRGMGYKFTP